MSDRKYGIFPKVLRDRKRDAETADRSNGLGLLGAMQGMPIYQGTVDPETKRLRRQKNKRAKASRKANR